MRFRNSQSASGNDRAGDERFTRREGAGIHPSAPPAKKTRIATHERAPKNKNLIDGDDDAALFFDESKVPVEVLAVANDEAARLDPADFEVISVKISYRLAQRPGSYVILTYVRLVIKLRADGALSSPPAPVGVLDGCRADVETTLGQYRPYGAVLQSDGYSAYTQYAKKTGITPAQCGAH